MQPARCSRRHDPNQHNLSLTRPICCYILNHACTQSVVSHLSLSLYTTQPSPRLPQRLSSTQSSLTRSSGPSASSPHPSHHSKSRRRSASALSPEGGKSAAARLEPVGRTCLSMCGSLLLAKARDTRARAPGSPRDDAGRASEYAPQRHSRLVATITRFATVMCIAIAVAKVYAYTRTGAAVMKTSALDSLGDLVANVIALYTGYRVASPDTERYPVGLGRLEPIGVLIFSTLMGAMRREERLD